MLRLLAHPWLPLLLLCFPRLWSSHSPRLPLRLPVLALTPRRFPPLHLVRIALSLRQSLRNLLRTLLRVSLLLRRLPLCVLRLLFRSQFPLVCFALVCRPRSPPRPTPRRVALARRVLLPLVRFLFAWLLTLLIQLWLSLPLPPPV